MKLIECPRDAMQGIKEFIPTDKKIEYINQLLKVGFDTLDCGSFVSAKAIPQLQDTAEVISKIDYASSKTKLLCIVANMRGAEDAAKFEQISYLGFPFSISETFQKRNTNSSIAESLDRVKEIQEVCAKSKKELVVYISMAFGNPYGDMWNKEIAIEWTEKLVKDVGVKIIALSDTIGVSNPENVSYMFSALIPVFKEVEFGAHLHTTPYTWKEKVVAAYNSGCRRFDSAIKGFGGCPMAADDLTGNMPTENILTLDKELNLNLHLNEKAFAESLLLADKVFLKA